MRQQIYRRGLWGGGQHPARLPPPGPPPRDRRLRGLRRARCGAAVGSGARPSLGSRPAGRALRPRGLRGRDRGDSHLLGRGRFRAVGSSCALAASPRPVPLKAKEAGASEEKRWVSGCPHQRASLGRGRQGRAARVSVKGSGAPGSRAARGRPHSRVPGGWRLRSARRGLGWAPGGLGLRQELEAKASLLLLLLLLCLRPGTSRGRKRPREAEDRDLPQVGLPAARLPEEDESELRESACRRGLARAAAGAPWRGGRAPARVRPCLLARGLLHSPTTDSGLLSADGENPGSQEALCLRCRVRLFWAVGPRSLRRTRSENFPPLTGAGLRESEPGPRCCGSKRSACRGAEPRRHAGRTLSCSGPAVSCPRSHVHRGTVTESPTEKRPQCGRQMSGEKGSSGLVPADSEDPFLGV
ncbi:uncharacterized protein LOC123929394 [Meles meles]|uniref:uncharacterized protein LOC123929394 n=1 Tax=Meles meles TaxID=9662 RepID=UPI001E69AD64|nr:uncharacterized protein LOC123929394 [Meles meles]